MCPAELFGASISTRGSEYTILHILACSTSYIGINYGLQHHDNPELHTS
jgi:hypothetical protein